MSATSTFEHPTFTTPAEADRVIVLYNPVSVNAVDWPRYVDDIRENSPFKTPLVIASQKRPEDTIEELGEKMRDGDLLYLLCGDGVGNAAAQFAGSVGSPDIALAYAPLGNALNDYHATIDESYDGQPSKVISDGVIKPIFPIRASIDGPDRYKRLAFSIDAGAVATGAEALDGRRSSRWYRNRHTRFTYETLVSLGVAMTKLRTLEIAEADGSNPHLALNVGAAAAPRIGKVAKFDTNITEHDFLLGILKDRLPWHQIPAMVQLMRGTLPVGRIKNNERSEAFLLTDSKRNRNARIQFDGEWRPLARGSIVRFDQPGYDDPTHHPLRAVIARGKAQRGR